MLSYKDDLLVELTSRIRGTYYNNNCEEPSLKGGDNTATLYVFSQP